MHVGLPVSSIMVRSCRLWYFRSVCCNFRAFQESLWRSLAPALVGSTTVKVLWLYIVSESHALLKLQSKSRQSTELELSKSEWCFAKSESFTVVVDTLLLQVSLTKLTMTRKKQCDCE